MILGFKDQFVPFVLDGSKTHTIRAGERWSIGMRADLYARPRQRDMSLLFREFARKVEPLCIAWEAKAQYPDVIIAGNLLSMDERDMLAWRDGFRFKHPDGGHYPSPMDCFGLMVAYWQRHHDLHASPFQGQVVHWDYGQRFMNKDGGPDLGRDSGKSRELQARGMTAGDIAVTDTLERLCDERRTVIRRGSRERPA